MKTILIATVGSSHQPIVASIQQHQPEHVHFLCSADAGKTRGSYWQVIGDGKVLKSKQELDKPDLPNIAALAALPEGHFTIHKIEHFDALNDCYLESLNVIEQARGAAPEARLLADYTGGTKSMTAGLAAAALDDGRCDIVLVAGRRDDLVKVRDRTEFVRPVPVWDVQALRRIQAARELLDSFDYAAAERLLCQAAARFAGERTLAALQRGIALCRTFDAWDKFDHATARSLLEPYQADFVSYWRFLKEATEDGRGHGFEWVEDLLLNAERRASQGRYDDAVGRLYRALELTAQVWLRRRHEIDTGDVQPEAVPEALRARVGRERTGDEAGETGKIKIGLLLAWDMIAAFSGDLLGERFAPQRGPILSFLTHRNKSLFAHGVCPVSAAAYDGHAPMLRTFLAECIRAGVQALRLKRPVVLSQLPTDFLDAPR